MSHEIVSHNNFRFVGTSRLRKHTPFPHFILFYFLTEIKMSHDVIMLNEQTKKQKHPTFAVAPQTPLIGADIHYIPSSICSMMLNINKFIKAQVERKQAQKNRKRNRSHKQRTCTNRFSSSSSCCKTSSCLIRSFSSASTQNESECVIKFTGK